jgi:hypothetical protein
MAREQIAMITRIAREGGCTLEESTVLIGHLQAYITASATVELGPRIARIEAAIAARAEQGDAQVGLVIQSDLPMLPGCEGLIMPNTLTIESITDERASTSPQIGSPGTGDGNPPAPDHD